MAKVLLIHPNKWGRGVTAIWIASHTAVLRSRGHEVELFDATFHDDWSVDEVAYNTANEQYRPSDYASHIQMSSTPVRTALRERIANFNPDVVFFSALSSHIHGEGEYVNIQYGHQLLEGLSTDAIIVTAGLQATAQPGEMFKRFPLVDYFIRGESEIVLGDLVDLKEKGGDPASLNGVVHLLDGKVTANAPQPIISDMDDIPSYDYTVFEDQAFFRPYNGEVVRAVDYELSRGCPFTCSYCVETVIQRYYGFTETVNNGVLRDAKSYLRNKSAERIFQEMEGLYETLGIRLFRCQDTNFLSIQRKVLNALADKIEASDLDIMLYIETRPETINSASVALLKRLRVDGVGMGIELASEEFRKSSLNRYPSQEKIENAFRLLRDAGIRSTAYNIIGLPGETEEMILDTVRFNRVLEPDNTTVAFYSPYMGTPEQVKSEDLDYFDDYEFHVDGQLRTLSRSTLVSAQLLEFYKSHFVALVKGGIEGLDALKLEAGIA
jgi:anaerobic magnesium-protoporphyrin IX monomethyl ester cyclase